MYPVTRDCDVKYIFFTRWLYINDLFNDSYNRLWYVVQLLCITINGTYSLLTINYNKCRYLINAFLK